MVNAQEWLDREYPKENRSEITRLNISWEKLEGTLDLNDFPNLKKLVCDYNKLTILDLSNCNQLEITNCSHNLLTSIIPPANSTNLKKIGLGWNRFFNQSMIRKYGWCCQCFQPNTSENWCQPCAEKKWTGLEGQELVEKFIQQQRERKGWKRWGYLQWIPYEQFSNIEQIGEGGFSKIYKAKCKEIEKYNEDAWNENVVLKSLNNSQNITLEFLTEIANTKLMVYATHDDIVVSDVVNCYGISQNPQTKNYVMVMEYKSEGNLRQYLQNKADKLSLWNKLLRLTDIARGLSAIHRQNLIHRDLHSGNILSDEYNSYISDLGLSYPANHQKEKDKIFGVLSYVAPEVLQGQPYTQASDVYSFGIVAYELMTNSYPYPELGQTELALRVCQGHRPNIDKVPIPQLLKDLIKSCWDANLEKRPSAEELGKIISWSDIYGRVKKDTPFYQQFQILEQEYNTFSQNTLYQIHPTATTTSKMIDTKEITEKLKTMEYSKSLILDFKNLNLENNSDWTNIHSSFTDELIHQWQSLGFTYEQCKEWINIGLQPTDHNFCAWLRDNKHFTPEQVLNESNLEQLNQEFFTYWQEQQQTNIEIPPKNS